MQQRGRPRSSASSTARSTTTGCSAPSSRRAGHRFASDHSDTEVLVHGWEEWGEDLFDRLNGMFAIAIWEPRERRLVLARDRYGIKPLYYAPLADGGLVFGSEIKAIHRFGARAGATLALGDPRVLLLPERLGRANDVRGRPPAGRGDTLDVAERPERLRRRTGTSHSRAAAASSLATLAEEHREILRRVVRRQIAADVPVMTYLSGGIDSTAITVVSHERRPERDGLQLHLRPRRRRRRPRRRRARVLPARGASTYGLNRVEHRPRPRRARELSGAYVGALEDLRMGMGYPVYLDRRAASPRTPGSCSRVPAATSSTAVTSDGSRRWD